MRRYCALSLLTAAALSLSAAPADAQTFWRWFEKLSGPTIGGMGAEIEFLCPPGQPDGAPVFSLDCQNVSQTAERWFSLGAQMYVLTGDNSMTAEPNDRIDVLGVMPFVTYHWIPGLTISAGPAIRRYSTPAGHITKVPVEVWAGARPGRLLRKSGIPDRNLKDDLLEVRAGIVRHGGFDAGDFGPGTEALPSEWSFHLGFLLDFSAWRR